MEFPFIPCETHDGTVVYRPLIPLELSHRGYVLPVAQTLVDTGADMTLLPMDIAKYLHVELDTNTSIQIASAGGGGFIAVPSKQPIHFRLEQDECKPIQWDAHVYFAPRQSVILLGYDQCLNKLILAFNGPQKILHIHEK